MTWHLIRKNLRVQRPAWLAMIVLSLACWPVAVFAMLAFSSRTAAVLLRQAGHWYDLTGFVMNVLVAGLGVMCVVAPALTGMSVAAERQERSAEFEFMLPIPIRRRVLTKLAASLLAAGVLLLVQTALFWLVFRACLVAENDALRVSVYDGSARIAALASEAAWTLITLFCGTACGMGVAWLMSGLLRSAAVSAAIGIGVPVAMFLMLVAPRNQGEVGDLMGAFRLVNLAVGAAGFAVGTAVLLRRRGA